MLADSRLASAPKRFSRYLLEVLAPHFAEELGKFTKIALSGHLMRPDWLEIGPIWTSYGFIDAMTKKLNYAKGHHSLVPQLSHF
jgi:hypothetical protein